MPTWRVSAEDVAKVLEEQNPWTGSNRRVPDALAPSTERALAKTLWQRLLTDEPHRFHVVLGPRRVGKTTVMYQTVRHLLDHGIHPRRLRWFRLDHPLLLDMPLGDLVKRVIQSTKPSHDEPLFIFLDELVYAKDWDLWLKTFYDERWPVRVVATSSATAALSRRRMETGVGRWEEQNLMPYLFSEFLELAEHPVETDLGPTLADSLERATASQFDLAGVRDLRLVFILVGGFPELLLGHAAPTLDDVETALLESQRILRSDAVERAIYKDIPQSFGVDQPMVLERLLYTLAGQTSNLLAPGNVAGALGISQPTFDRYVSYLVKAFVVFTLPNYSGSEAAVQRRGRKLYFVDGAVRNAALQRGIAPLHDSAEMGVLVENLVASQLHTLALQTGTRLYHWRDSKQHEVDFVFDHPERPLAVEVGLSADHSRDGLRAFAERYPRFKGNCYLIAPNASPVRADEARSGIATFPLDAFVILAGKHAERALATA